MQIIAGGRQTGKTMQLVKMSAMTNIPIIVPNQKRKDWLIEFAKILDIEMPRPIVINRLHEKYPRPNNVLVDDTEDILQYLFRQQFGTDIFAITMTTGDDNNG